MRTLRVSPRLWGVVAAAAGCLSCGPDPGDAPIGALEQARKSSQGTDLKGGVQTGAQQFFTAQLAPAVDRNGSLFLRMEIEAAELVATRMDGVRVRGSGLKGARLPGATRGQALPDRILRIAAVHPHRAVLTDGTLAPAPTPGEFEYEIEIYTAAATPVLLGKLCGPTPADPSRSSVAMPLRQKFSPEGMPEAGAVSDFSFACLGSAVTKCVDFGYKPYETNAVMAPRFSSCLRMARADYCGDGQPHTVTGTVIDVYDYEGTPVAADFPQNAREGLDGFFFEAGWYADRDAGPNGALCLSKKRWDTLPLDGFCPALIPDPRRDPALGGRYCEEIGQPFAMRPSLPAMRAAGAALFNDSSFLDVGLYRWRRQDRSEHYTSTRYVLSNEKIAPEDRRVLLEADGATELLGYRFARMEGAAFRTTAPRTARGSATTRLRLYHSPSRKDYYLSSRARPPRAADVFGDGLSDYRELGEEGFLYPAAAPPPRSVPLHSWYSAARHEHLTTTDPAWGASSCQAPGGACTPGALHQAGAPDDPAGQYRYVRLEGHLPR